MLAHRGRVRVSVGGPRRFAVAVCMACDQPFISENYGHGNVRRTCSEACLRKVRPLNTRHGATNNRWRGGVPLRTCTACGATFRKYDTQRGPRRFCSRPCANRAHKESVYEMSKRIQYEHEAWAILEREGFRCLRSAGSRGPVDLFAFSPTECWLIQVKSTKRLTHPATVSMLRDATLDLLGVVCPPATRKWLFVRELRGGWYRECVDRWPADRLELSAWIREVIHRWRDRARLPDSREL